MQIVISVLLALNVIQLIMFYIVVTSQHRQIRNLHDWANNVMEKQRQ